MSRARKLADLLDASGDVRNDAMDNVALSDLNVTATAAEVNTLDGITATTSELNLLDGVTATTAELNYVDGVTSNIQTQIDNIASDLVDDTTPQLGGDLDTNGNDVNFGDNDKAQFGAGNDLQVYHDGSNSIIKDAGTGNLKIQGSGQVRIEDASGNVGAVFNANTDAVLKYAGSNKLVTTSTGVDVTGQIDVNSAARIDSSGRVKGANGTVGAPSFSFLNDPDNGMFRPTTNTLGFATAGAERFRVESGGNLNFNVEGSNNFRSGIDLRQGSAKGWRTVDNKGTFTNRDSYNVSSNTDNALGVINTNWNNDFNNNNYSYAGSIWSTSTNGAAVYGYDVLTAATVRIGAEDVDSGFTDYDYNQLAAHGDLA